jgi:hypothetical protein
MDPSKFHLLSVPEKTSFLWIESQIDAAHRDKQSQPLVQARLTRCMHVHGEQGSLRLLLPLLKSRALSRENSCLFLSEGAHGRSIMSSEADSEIMNKVQVMRTSPRTYV